MRDILKRRSVVIGAVVAIVVAGAAVAGGVAVAGLQAVEDLGRGFVDIDHDFLQVGEGKGCGLAEEYAHTAGRIIFVPTYDPARSEAMHLGFTCMNTVDDPAGRRFGRESLRTLHGREVLHQCAEGGSDILADLVPGSDRHRGDRTNWVCALDSFG